MSEVTSGVLRKSSISDGEFLTDKQVINISDSGASNNTTACQGIRESKLKRTFTLTRNALSGTRISKRRGKHKDNKDSLLGKGSMVIDSDNMDLQKQNKKLFRRPSWNKFINKMVQKVSTLGVNNNKNLCSTYVYSSRRRAAPVTLSSSDVRVPPTRPLHFANGDKVPGVIGLRNHGNTCFINAVLQCLSHTDVLAEYFVLDQYKVDLSRRNKLNSKKYGTKGEVTEQLALLLKSIWSCQYDPEMTNKFKLVVDKYGSQYRGNNQHDAQEFLLWLLDKVHEDLNTATKKKYKVIKNTFGRPDDIVAAETLANHVRCNNSFVHAVFQAQFRSSLTCPRCKRQSNTFDPFLCVSVPVPQDQFKAVFVTVLYTSQQPRQVKLGLSLPLHADVKDLRELLSSDTGIPEAHMLITEIDDLGFHRTFSDKQPISCIKHTDPIYCLELPQLKEANQDTGEYILLCWINVLILDDQCARFCSPFTMQVCRETSYLDLQKLLLKEMSWTLHDDILTTDQEVPLFRIRVCDAGGEAGTGDHSYLDPAVDHPLYTQPIDQALAVCDPGSGQPHVKLVLEWDLQAKESTIADDSDQVEEHASVKQLKANAEQGRAVTLEECFELYTRAEVLGADNAWHCPNCNLKQEVEKKLGLWSLPDILVIHLKRFRQSGAKHNQISARSTVKLTTLVDFPPYGFDMSPHVCPNQYSSGGGRTEQQGPGLLWSPWKRPRSLPPPLADEYTYDLYAVCNHHGQDLQSGHYTAFCRNPYDTKWYCFDDAKVTPVSESQLVSSAAYILFYQRRGLVSQSSASSTSSTTGPEHWAARLISNQELTEENEANDDIHNTCAQPSGKHSVATETTEDLIEPVRDNIVNSPTCERASPLKVAAAESKSINNRIMEEESESCTETTSIKDGEIISESRV